MVTGTAAARNICGVYTTKVPSLLGVCCCAQRSALAHISRVHSQLHWGAPAAVGPSQARAVGGSQTRAPLLIGKTIIGPLLSKLYFVYLASTITTHLRTCARQCDHVKQREPSCQPPPLCICTHVGSRCIWNSGGGCRPSGMHRMGIPSPANARSPGWHMRGDQANAQGTHGTVDAHRWWGMH